MSQYEDKINLGQKDPAATVLWDIFTVPAGAQAVISSIVCANVSGSGGTDDHIRISHAIDGAADTIAQYLYYDIVVEAQDTFTAQDGIVMNENDILRVYSETGITAFNVYGVLVQLP